MRKPVSLFLIVLLVVGGPAPSVFAASDKDAVCSGLNDFAADVYRKLAMGGKEVCFSPLSIAMALAMVEEGAVGETAAELERVLGLPKGSAQGFRDLIEALQPQIPTTWRCANRLYVQERFPLETDFTDILKNGYHADLKLLDFAGNPDSSRVTINRWVESQTGGEIPEFLNDGSISPLTRLVLVNALYLHAKWRVPFEKRSTRPAPFYGPAGATSVLTMHAAARFRVGSFPDVDVIELDYTEEDLCMMVVVPKSEDKLQELDQGLTADLVAAWEKQLRPRSTILSLPKFELRQRCDMTPTLMELGVQRIFGGKGCDLSGISAEEPLWVDRVQHEAVIKVDEEGVTAAAATAAVLLGSSLAQPEPFRFDVDRPFLTLIRHQPTGLLLFVGKVLQPDAVE